MQAPKHPSTRLQKCVVFYTSGTSAGACWAATRRPRTPDAADAWLCRWAPKGSKCPLGNMVARLGSLQRCRRPLFQARLPARVIYHAFGCPLLGAWLHGPSGLQQFRWPRCYAWLPALVIDNAFVARSLRHGCPPDRFSDHVCLTSAGLAG